jgi:hypothetical protein
MSGATTSLGELVARIGIASARYELYERLAHKALQKCTPEQVLELLKELKIEQYERNMLKMDGKLSNETCGECRYLGSAKETGVCEKRKICLYPEELLACSNFEQKVITNGDKIRAIADNKKFAYYICEVSTEHKLFTADDLADWLNAPADCEGKDEEDNLSVSF